MAGREEFFYLDPRSLKVRAQASHRLDRPFAVDIKVSADRRTGNVVLRALYQGVRIYAVFGEITDNRLVRLRTDKKFVPDVWPDGFSRLIRAIDVVCDDPTLKRLGLSARRYNFYIPATAVAA